MTDRDKIIAILRKSVNIKIPDIISWIIGIKSVIYAEQDDNLILFLHSLFPTLKSITVSAAEAHRPASVMLLSKNRDSLTKSVLYLKNSGNSGNSELGRMLGYPDCCIKAHQETFLHQPTEERASVSAFSAAKKSIKTSFLLNNLLSFVTRLNDPNLIDMFINYHKTNGEELRPIIDNQPMSTIDISFISHLPCRYDCEASLVIARQVDNWLSNNIPELREFMKNKLARPFLIFDTLNWLAFDGLIEDNCLKYNKILSPFAPIKTEAVDYIKKGDKLLIDDDQIIISKGNNKLFVYKKMSINDGYLIDFSNDE